MKNLLLILFVFTTIYSSAQNISGIYSGTIKNDSLKMVQNYELALSEYKGKITGYSYITFVKNDTFYYGIKRIKATRENGQLVVVDDEMLMNNYPQRPDKGVHLINTFPLTQGDSILDLNGTWKTTASKRHGFYSIGGDMSLRKDNDSSRSPLISHLKELQVIKYQEDKKTIAKKEIRPKQDVKDVDKEKLTASVKNTASENKKEEEKSFSTQPSENSVIAQSKPEVGSAASQNAQNSSVANTSNQQKEAIKHTSATETRSNQSKMLTAQAERPKETNTSIAASPKDNSSTVVNNQPKAETTVAKNTDLAQTSASTSKIEVAKEMAVVSPLDTRTNNTIQTVDVVSDSLTLSFYDNGIVDGDSISVFVNNENIISKVKLTEVAAKKTIYTTSSTGEIKVTLVAESLGSIPPNTGLLIIQDGVQRYNIRFSADMETNASVIIKKKKP